MRRRGDQVITTGRFAGRFGTVDGGVYQRSLFSPEPFYGNGLPVVMSFFKPIRGQSTI